MLCENLVSTQNQALDLTVTVRATNLDLPRSEEELRDELLAHALECHECLTVVLFQEDMLADAGCETYRRMFAEATEQLLLVTPVDPKAHLTRELIEAFFLDKLCEEQMAAMAEHVEGCADCAHDIQSRQAFYLSVRASLGDVEPSHNVPTALHGILGLSAPDADIYLCSRIHDR